MLTVQDVATYFLTKADPEVGDLISNLKLQKLCYYAQGFHLAIYGNPLFPEPIEAWQHGPVIPDLYHAYKAYSGSAIPAPEQVELSKYSDEESGLLDEVYEVYGQYSAWKLRNLTHQEAPWVDANAADDTYISNDSLKDYFKTLLK